MTNKKRQRASGHSPAKAFLSQPQATEVIPSVQRSAAKRNVIHELRDEDALADPRQEHIEQANQQPTEMRVMPRVRRSTAKRRVNDKLRDENEVEEPRQEQIEKQVMASKTRKATTHQFEHDQHQSTQQIQPQVSKHQSRLPPQPQIIQQVIPRVRRSNTKKKRNLGLQDEDEVEELELGHEQNEQVTPQPTREREMTSMTLKETTNEFEHVQHQRRQPPQPQVSQHQSRQQSQPQVRRQPPQPQVSQQQSGQPPQPETSQQASWEQEKRGPTFLPSVWARRPGEGRILVNFNKRGQPIGLNKKKLTGFLGTLARNGKYAPLDIEDWRKVPKVRKDEIIRIVKERFEIPQGAERWILLSTGKKRRYWRSRVKTGFFKPTLPVQDQVYNRPDRVLEDQWTNLLPHWSKEDIQEVCEKNKDRRELSVMQQTTGKLSFAEVEQELREQLGRTPTRLELFCVCYSDSSGNPQTIEVQDALTQMTEHHLKLPAGAQDKIGPNDSFAKVRGKDPDGRVRMLGLGVNPSDMWGDIPSRNTCYRMVLENQEALARMEEKMNRTIADFQQRMQAQQNPNPNNISEPRRPTSPVQSSNSVSPGRRLQVGASVSLKSIFDQSKTVAKGFVRSIDPDHEVGGMRLGLNWYEVQISCPLDWDADLIRPYSDFSTIGDAIGTYVAWPRNLVVGEDEE